MPREQVKKRDFAERAKFWGELILFSYLPEAFAVLTNRLGAPLSLLELDVSNANRKHLYSQQAYRLTKYARMLASPGMAAPSSITSPLGPFAASSYSNV